MTAPSPRPKGRWLWATVIAAFVSGLIIFRVLNPPGRPFDRELWDRAETGAEDCPRLQMADRLIADGSLIGKSSDEVVERLGKPTRDKNAFEPDWDIAYVLGIERGGFIRIDSEWLAIRFDNSGRVSKVGLTRD